MDLPAIVWAPLVLYSFYFGGSIIYNLFFHPLAKFPGPRLAAASRLYEFWYDILSRGQYADEIERMHDLYGPVVRPTPNEVHVRDPTWCKVILAGPGHARDKDPSLASPFGTPFGTFGTAAHALHKRRRAPMATFFAKRAVESQMQGAFWESAEALCDLLCQAHEQAQVLEARPTFIAWATDSLTAASFGQSIGLLKDPQMAIKHAKVFQAFGVLFPLLKLWPWLISTGLELPALPFRLLFPPLATLLDVHVEMSKLAQQVCTEHAGHKKDPEKTRQTIFQEILDSDMPEDEKNARRISHEGLEVFLAGGYTTSKAISYLIYFVLADPQLTVALKDELRKAIPDPYEHKDLGFLQELTLLSAVIKEALRIGPVVFNRATLIATDETLRYKDWVLPSGIRISSTPGTNGHDPAYFPNPHRFDPYRWIDCDPAALVEMNRVFMPFSTGNRSCYGMHLVYAELYIAVATIFRRFDLELYKTERARDIDRTWSHLASEPSHGSRGLRFKVTGVIDAKA